MNYTPRKGSLLNRIPPRGLERLKALYQFLRRPKSPPKVLFIVGCQRSGTTLMLEVFRRDLETKTYGEFSKLSSDDPRRIRLNPLQSVRHEIHRARASLVVLKPLVESQNVLELLNYFEGGLALWMYRDYRDVASSNLRKFGAQNGVNDLRPIVENAAGNWRAERVGEDVRGIVADQYSESMNPFDAAVLFWYVRNRLFFDLGLDSNPNVLACKYEDLVAAPERVMRGIYAALGNDFPGPRIIEGVHFDSLRRGKDISISPAVDKMAGDLLRRLDDAYGSPSSGR